MKKTLTLVLAFVLVLYIALPVLSKAVSVPLTDDKLTFTIAVRKEELSQNTWAEKECVNFTEEQTNIHIEWIEIPNAGWNEKVNLMLASGDLPDAFIGGIDVVANQGVLTSLTEYIDSSAPNVLEMFDTLPEMRGALMLGDGNIYSLPTGDADVKNQINGLMWINQSWLSKLGLSTPNTIDELYDVLVAFRDQDPNGNGLPDEIPLLVSNSQEASRIDSLFGFFGTLDNNDHIRVQDSEVIFTPAEDGYFEALQWLHKLYNEKLMNQEYFTEDYQQYVAKGNSETCVTGIAMDWYIDNIILGSYVSDYTYLTPVKGPSDTTLWNKSKLPVGTLNGFVITNSCSNPELLVKWYDYINSSLDILNLWNYGPENLIWRYREDGKWELFTDNVTQGSSSSQIRRTMGTGPMAPLYAYSRFRGPDVEQFANRIVAKVEANEAYMPYTPAESVPNGFGDTDETNERNMLLVDIDNYLNQFRANAIVSGITQGDWQTHLNMLQTLNVDEYTGYWQSFYNAHK